MNKRPQKILIRGVNWIGDAILTIPALQSIRSAFPDVHIAVLVRPWVKQIFQEIPAIDEIIIYDDQYRGILGKIRLAKMLRLKKFDTAFLLQNAFDAALVSWLARIPQRIGYKIDNRAFLLTEAVPVPKDILSKHQVFYYLNLLNSIGIETTTHQPYLSLTASERHHAEKILKPLANHQGPLIGINPGATYGPAKRWLPERFGELIIKITDELKGSVVIFGSSAETEITNKIISSVREQGAEIRKKNTEQRTNNREYSETDQSIESRILNLSGKTNLRELAALISLCNAFITNDSGPMHMASALFVPTVAVFGSTNKKTTGPFGHGHQIVSKDLPCAPCLERECPEKHLRCITEIKSDEVFNALKEILPQNRAVFLDRDGTVIEDRHYLNTFDNLVIFPYAKDSLTRLREHGFKLIGITNQSGIARKIIEEKFVIELNAQLKDTLGIDDFYYCPHHPDERCICRKPEPLMIHLAKITHGINIKNSFVIGDKESDILLAKNVGATGILLSSQSSKNSQASYVAKDLKEAVQWILDKES